MTNEEKTNVEYRLSDIGEQVGELALEYISELKKEIDYYKSRESHWDEIEEDAKRIAEENAELKAQIEKMKCCGNCKNCVFKYDDEDLIFECDVNGTESYTHLKTCTNWELAE